MEILPHKLSSTSFSPFTTRTSTLFIPAGAIVGIAGDGVGEAGWRVAIDVAVGTDIWVAVGCTGVEVGGGKRVGVGDAGTGVGGKGVYVGILVGVLVAATVGVLVGELVAVIKAVTDGVMLGGMGVIVGV